MKRGRLSVSGWRDLVLFVTGWALIVHEAVLREGPERPSLLVLYAGMIGLPAFLRKDEKPGPQASEQDA